ncbi:glycosyltransferase [Sphingomonas crusticola]|uniref:glycosyltransferase n=1 Tax=Sphingomonas crusticola TaxID=1697973 RepID=UPI000E238AE4|nr:glycosyltransferase [Sphingomonas crusticola]
MQIKILHLIASADPATGGPIEGILRQEEVTGGYGNAAIREIATLDAPGQRWAANYPVALHCLGDPGGRASRHNPIGWFLRHYGYTPRYIPWLQTNMHRFDVAIVHGLWNYCTFAAAQVLPKSGFPYFVFTHGMMDPWFRRRYPLKHIAKQISWTLVEGRLLRHARSILFTTQEERLLARKSFWGHPYRETVVGYGTASPPDSDPSAFARLIDLYPHLRSRKFLLFLSRIHEKKGCDDLLVAFAAVARDFPDVDLMIAGPDQQGRQPALVELAATLGIGSRVLWPGPLYGAEKWAAYRAADAFVLASHQENFGIVVAEALACGTPVLITDKVNIWREVEAAGAGIIAHDDPRSVEQQLRQWLALTPEARAEMRAAAERLFKERFCMAEIAPGILRNMRIILEEKKVHTGSIGAG